MLVRLQPSWNGADIAVDPDGFVHLSAPAQAAATARRHYADVDDLDLIAVDELALDPALLRWERADAAPFPHLYTALPATAVLGSVPYPRDRDGLRHTIPRGLSAMRPCCSFDLRTAGSGDSRSLAELQWRAIGIAYERIFPAKAPYPTVDDLEAQWADAIDGASSSVVVARAQDRPAACVVACVGDSGRGRLARLHVAPEFWGYGLGAVMRDAATSRLRDTGYVTAELWVLEENARARALYEAAGWKLDPSDTMVWPGGSPTEVRYLLPLS